MLFLEKRADVKIIQNTYIRTDLLSFRFFARLPVVSVLYNHKTFGRWQALLLAATSLAYYICYHGLLSSAINGVPGGVYFDVLCVCIAGQFVTIFSDFYGMLVFMLVSVNLVTRDGVLHLHKCNLRSPYVRR